MRHTACDSLFLCLSVVLAGCGSSADPSGEQDPSGSAGGTTSAAGGSLSTSGSGGLSGASGGSLSAGGTGDATSSGGSGGNGAVDSGGTAGSREGGTAGSGEGGTAPHVVLPCDSLSGPGQWENITPHQVNLDAGFKTPGLGTNFGATSFVISPKNRAVVYLGTSSQGIYKSTDCGATWALANTGRNGDQLGKGGQWTFQIDSSNPDTLYANSGYSAAGNWGAWKSTNGGVDWNPLFDAKTSLVTGFVHMIAIDPTNSQHLIVTPHFTCNTGVVNGMPKTEHCLLETTDAGATWQIHDNTPAAGEGQGIWITDAQTWYWAAAVDGLYRTADGGGSWQHLYSSGYALPHPLLLGNGTLFVGGVYHLLQGTNNGLTWASLDNSPATDGVAGDATVLFSVKHTTFNTASVSNLASWKALPSPNISDPAEMQAVDLQYDPDHHLLYSVHNLGGFWRLVTQ